MIHHAIVQEIRLEFPYEWMPASQAMQIMQSD
jgi:hypothetical protein